MRFERRIARVDIERVARFCMDGVQMRRGPKGKLQLRNGLANQIRKVPKDAVDLPLFRKFQRSKFIIEFQGFARLDKDRLAGLRDGMNEARHAAFMLDFHRDDVSPLALCHDLFSNEFLTGEPPQDGTQASAKYFARRENFPA